MYVEVERGMLIRNLSLSLSLSYSSPFNRLAVYMMSRYPVFTTLNLALLVGSASFVFMHTADSLEETTNTSSQRQDVALEAEQADENVEQKEDIENTSAKGAVKTAGEETQAEFTDGGER